MTESHDRQASHLKEVGLQDGNLPDIAYTALVLASMDRPGVSLQKYQHHLKILTLDLEAENVASDTAVERAQALSRILHGRHEYTGNEKFYDDLQNANLMSVIDTRKGLSVSLGILYMHAARSQGWHIEGLKFPGHFLIRLFGKNQSRDGQVIIDPFNEGKSLDARDLRKLLQKKTNTMTELKPDYFKAVTDRGVLVRLLSNIKVRCLKASDLNQAINILARLVMIDPERMQHHYEMGMLLAHIGKSDMARDTLCYCLEHIERIEKNDLIEHQILNTLKDIEENDPDNTSPLS